MAHVLHVAIGFTGKPADVKDVQTTFGGAGWARYAPNCWLVHTSESPADIARRIRAICKEDDSIFVTQVNLATNFGWLQKEIWDWINSNR